MNAPRALRCYRGPDDPSPMMETVNTLSHHLRNMANSGDARKILRLEQDCPGGHVEVVRVNNVDYVYTELAQGRPVFILKEGNGTYVFIYDLTGKLLRYFDTGHYGDIVSADKDGVHLFYYLTYADASNYSKYDYNGKLLYSKDYAAGEISYAIGYLNHDVTMSWENPGVWDTGGVNTDYLSLYKNYELVKTISRSCTTSVGESFSACAINDYGIVASVRRVIHPEDHVDEYDSWIEYYDFDLNLIYTSEEDQRPNTGPKACTYAYDIHSSINKPFYAACNYQSGNEAKSFEYDQTIPGFKPGVFFPLTTIDSSAYYFGIGLGIVNGVYYVWCAQVSWEGKVTIFPYDLKNNGAEGAMITFSTPDDYSNIYTGCIAIVDF